MERMLSIVGIVALSCIWSASAQASVFITRSLDNGTSCGQTIFSPAPLLGQTAACSGTDYSMLFKNEASETSLRAYSDIDRTGATRRLIALSISESETMLTISGGSGTGLLQFQIDLSGDSGPGGCLSSASLDFSCASLVVFGNPGISFGLQSKGNATLTGAIPFTFGVAFQFRMYLEVDTELQAGSSSVFRYTDFYNTAELAPFVVLDSSGVRLSGVSALSDTGYSYRIQAPSTIPEPASPLLIGIGLACFAVVRRFCRASA